MRYERLGRVSIKARLWLLFGIAVGVCLLVMIVGVVNMELAKKDTQNALELADRLTVAVDETRETQVDFKRQVKEWKDLLLRGTEHGHYDTYWGRFVVDEKKVIEGFGEIRASFAELQLDTAMVDSAQRACNELGIKARKALEKFDKNRRESAFDVDANARGLDKPATTAIDALVEQILARKKVLSAEIEKRVIDRHQNAVVFMIASGTVLAVVLALLSVAIMQSINHPLTRTIGIFDSIRGGNLSTDIPSQRHHETGALWNSLEAMQATLRQNTDTLKKNLEEIAALQEKSEKLLLNILPGPIAKRLREKHETIADAFPEVTVLFADMVGFTTFSQKVNATELVVVLNKIFVKFDRLAGEYGVEKIKTIGDCYMAVGGLPETRKDHAQIVARLAMAMLVEMDNVSKEVGADLKIRIGMNSGPVVAGVIGERKFIYDLWGDAVNTASRMESHGLPSQIHISESTYQLLKDEFECEDRGVNYVKGKGEMHTYFLKGPKSKVPAPAAT